MAKRTNIWEPIKAIKPTALPRVKKDKPFNFTIAPIKSRKVASQVKFGKI